MLKVYSSEMCPDCVACKEAFDANGVAYEITDINKSLKNLKEFLRYRDADPVFDETKANGGIGIPALLMEDGSITLDWEGYLKENGIEAGPRVGTGAACRLDGKGC